MGEMDPCGGRKSCETGISSLFGSQPDRAETPGILRGTVI